MDLNNISIFDKNKKLKNKEVSVICKKMSILIESGCEITNTLEILSQQSNKKIRNIFKDVLSQIRNGNSITESFQNTNVFSSLFINMLNTGELSGNLDKVMNDLADYYEQEQKIKMKVKTISIYPIILVVLSIATMFFMLIFVIPNFQMVFDSSGITPPKITLILIKMSAFVRVNYLFILFGSIIILLSIYYVIKNSNKAKQFIDILKINIPFIKSIVQLTITTRFCRALNILIQSGVHIVEAIEISSKVVDNEIIHNRLKVSKEYIERGNGISYSIEQADVFSKSFISMLKIGEESGSLDKTLSTTNKFYNEELNIKVEQFMRYVEPTVTVIIGIGVGIFIIGMIMPIFDAVNSI